MKIVYFGDVVGKAGREAIYKHLPTLRDNYKADFLEKQYTYYNI